MDRPRCGIVGAGRMGRWHVDAARRAGAAIAFIIDSDVDRARRLAASLRLRDCEVAASLEPALAESATQVVHVCTPVSTHATLALQAIDAGRHVLVEKPLADTEAVTAQLLDLAARRHVLLCPVHQVLFQRGVLEAARALAQLGDVLHFDAFVCSAGAEGRSAEERDEISADILPHAFALIERFVGPSVGDVSWRVVRERPGELRVVGALREASITILISMGGRPTRNEAVVTCASGTIDLDLYHGFAVVDGRGVSRVRKALRPFRRSGVALVAAGVNLATRAARAEWAYPGLRELVACFYASVRHGAPLPIPPAEALSVARARDQVLAAGLPLRR